MSNIDQNSPDSSPDQDQNLHDLSPNQENLDLNRSTPKDDEKHSSDDEAVEKPNDQIPKATPAIVRAKQLRTFFQSPTDAVMSPFSQSFAGRGHVNHPILLKQKPKRLNEPPTFKK